MQFFSTNLQFITNDKIKIICYNVIALTIIIGGMRQR